MDVFAPRAQRVKKTLRLALHSLSLVMVLTMMFGSLALLQYHQVRQMNNANAVTPDALKTAGANGLYAWMKNGATSINYSFTPGNPNATCSDGDGGTVPCPQQSYLVAEVRLNGTVSGRNYPFDISSGNRSIGLFGAPDATFSQLKAQIDPQINISFINGNAALDYVNPNLNSFWAEYNASQGDLIQDATSPEIFFVVKPQDGQGWMTVFAAEGESLTNGGNGNADRLPYAIQVNTSTDQLGYTMQNGGQGQALPGTIIASPGLGATPVLGNFASGKGVGGTIVGRWNGQTQSLSGNTTTGRTVFNGNNFDNYADLNDTYTLGYSQIEFGCSIFGCSYSRFQQYRGQIAEIMVYQRSLSGTERAQVNSYLATKWGIGLRPESGVVRYLNSDGVEMLNESAISPFINNIVGILRDSGYELNQLSSRNQDGGDVLTISSAGLNDGVGHYAANNGAGFTSTNLNKPSTVQKRFDRLWKISENADAGNITYTFDLGSNADGYDLSRLNLYRDTDTTLGDAAIVANPTVNGQTVSYTANVPNGSILFLGETCPVGQIELNGNCVNPVCSNGADNATFPTCNQNVIVTSAYFDSASCSPTAVVVGNSTTCTFQLSPSINGGSASYRIASGETVHARIANTGTDENSTGGDSNACALSGATLVCPNTPTTTSFSAGAKNIIGHRPGQEWIKGRNGGANVLGTVTVSSIPPVTITSANISNGTCTPNTFDIFAANGTITCTFPLTGSTTGYAAPNGGLQIRQNNTNAQFTSANNCTITGSTLTCTTPSQTTNTGVFTIDVMNGTTVVKADTGGAITYTSSAPAVVSATNLVTNGTCSPTSISLTNANPVSTTCTFPLTGSTTGYVLPANGMRIKSSGTSSIVTADSDCTLNAATLTCAQAFDYTSGGGAFSIDLYANTASTTATVLVKSAAANPLTVTINDPDPVFNCDYDANTSSPDCKPTGTGTNCDYIPGNTTQRCSTPQPSTDNISANGIPDPILTCDYIPNNSVTDCIVTGANANCDYITDNGVPDCSAAAPQTNTTPSDGVRDPFDTCDYDASTPKPTCIPAPLSNTNCDTVPDNGVADCPNPPPSSTADTDNDGIQDREETKGPNSGDANGDGVADSLQPGVATVNSLQAGKYVVLTLSNSAPATCTRFSSVAMKTESVSGLNDTTHEYPFGLVSFTLNGCTQADVTADWFTGDTKTYNPRKLLQRTPGQNTTLAYTTLSAAITKSTKYNQAVQSYKFTLRDGQLGDLSGVDTIIIDPTGLGESIVIPPPTPRTGAVTVTLFAGIVLSLVAVSLIFGAAVHSGHLRKINY